MLQVIPAQQTTHITTVNTPLAAKRNVPANCPRGLVFSHACQSVDLVRKLIIDAAENNSASGVGSH